MKAEVDKRTEDEVMLIGHCPGIEMYLSQLINEDKAMKTSHLAVIDMDDKELVDFIRPKDL